MPDQHTTYDLIIAGAGAAGLSLAWHLSRINGPMNRILLLDNDLSLRNERTWCFWSDERPPFADLIHCSWSRAAVAFDGGTDVVTEDLAPYTYYCLKERPYREHILGQLEVDNRFELLETSIIAMEGNDRQATVQTSAGTFHAPWIMQSCLPPPAWHHRPANYPLWQHFVGWEVETQNDTFNRNLMTLMDFDPEVDEDVAFTYTLPESPRKALVEYTVFSRSVWNKDIYEEKLRSYLSTRFNLSGGYTIHRSEGGKIPMQDRSWRPWYAKRVMNIGTMGALPKPSTGYAFMRIQRQAQALAKKLQQDGNPQPVPPSPMRYFAYDLWLLHLMDKHPDDAHRVLKALFHNNPLPNILRFLDERATVSQDLAIMSSVPWFPFFRAMAATSGRLLREREERKVGGK